MRRANKKRQSNRRIRSWAQVEKIVGAGVRLLPTFLRNGLYGLIRSGLSDEEIRRAYARCQGWTAQAVREGVATCDCGCGTRLPINAVNAAGKSRWCLDHCKHTKTFRGVLFARCNREVGDGDPQRKERQADYARAHNARLSRNGSESLIPTHDEHWSNEFSGPAAWPD